MAEFLKPAPGRSVPLPDGSGMWPAEGRATDVYTAPDQAKYIRRRKAAGDLVAAKPQAPAPAAPSAADEDGAAEGGRRGKRS